MGPLSLDTGDAQARTMAVRASGVALASIALMALCCVVVLHVNDDHAVKMDIKEGHDVYDSDMDNLMELLQETSEKRNKDSLNDEDKALITAANGRTLSLTPKKKAVAKLSHMKHTSYAAPKAHKKQAHRPLVVHQDMPKHPEKPASDPQDELSNEDKALLAAADGPKKEDQKEMRESEEPVEEHESEDPRDQLSNEDKALLAAADGLAKPKRRAHRVVKKVAHKVVKKHAAKKVVKKAVRVHKMKAKAKKAPKKAPVQMYHKHSMHHVHERHSGKDGLSNSEKALLAAADAGAHHKAPHHKKAQKQIRQMMHHAKKMHTKKMKKKVVHHMKKASHKHNKAKLVAKKQAKKQPRKAVKLPTVHHLTTEVKADNLESMSSLAKKKKKKPVLPKAMRRAMEKATKQALASATKDSLHRATEDVAAHAVDAQTHVGLHGASRAVKRHLAHLKKVSLAKAKKAAEKAHKKALKRKEHVRRVSVNLAARAIVLNKPTNADDALAAKDDKLAKIKEKIRALKAQEESSASDEWAKMKAKTDKEAAADANDTNTKHHMTAKEKADARAMQAKLEKQHAHK